MEIVKGSQEYYDYVMEYMIPEGQELYEIFTLDVDLFVDMVDTDTSYTFTDEEVAAAKSGLLQGRKVSRSQDRELASSLNSNLRLDRTMAFGKKYEQQIEKLSAKDT